MGRRSDVEFLRVVSTFLIVWYHCPSRWPDVSYAGLIFFVITSTYFALARNIGADGAVPRQKIARLLLIWLFWYFLYALIALLDGSLQKIFDGSASALLLVGPAVHLWYLPFLSGIVAVAPIMAKALRQPAALAFVGAAFLSAMGLVDFWRAWSLDLGVPWAQYIHALPAVFLGFVFAGMRESQLRVRLLVVGVALLCTVLALHSDGVGVPYFVGLALAATILLPWPQNGWVDKVSILSKYMMGVYLIHPVIIRVLRRLLALQDLWLAVAGFALALCIVIAMHSRAPRLAKAVM
jgi:surface polysaccharide O-acyltransferase-like enzyme